MKSLPKLKRNYCKQSELDKIMFGSNIVSSKEKLPVLWVVLAMWRYKIAMYIFRKRGLKGIVSYVQQKSRLDKKHEHSSNNLQYIRRYMTLFRFWGKLYRENWNCLAQASSLFVALYTLGFDIDLVIGKFVYCASESFDFHAWVEICGEPINDKRSVYERCIVIYRYRAVDVRPRYLKKSINNKILTWRCKKDEKRI